MNNRSTKGALGVVGAIALLFGATATSACGDDTGTGAAGGGGSGGGSSLTDQDIQPVVDGYAGQVHDAYEIALTRARDLQTAVNAFVDAPSQETLDAARDAWVAARPAYLETEVFRFYGGPIDNEETGPEGRINGWPLDEFYIDYVLGPNDEVMEVGIVNDPEGFPEITKEVIAEANENGGEKNLSAGFHAIEFLLWGQDQSETGPGNRPFTDYVVGAEGTHSNQDRRGEYLRAVTELLVEDIEFVEDAWEPGEGYAATFVGDDPTQSLTKMLVGMGSLSGAELSTERMNNAYQERDQEEEHSCFSDTTHIDHLHDLLGIENVYLGRLGDEDGAGIDDLVKKVDAALDEKMKADLTAAKEAIEAIPQPFDQAIVDDTAGGGREKIAAAIDSLEKLTDTTVDVATALGVELIIE
ncbi:MAG: iron-regulated protein [Polyangiaceae bacterium]|nr:iron-regulated protein [Polyangiaceae bacterium]